MLLRPSLGNRCGNSLAGAIPAGVFGIAAIGALGSGQSSAALGGFVLTGAFIGLAVRCFRMRVETTVTTLTVHGMFRTRRIARTAIIALDKSWTGGAAVPAAASGVRVPSVRWREADGRIRTTPIWALAASRRELGRWRRSAALQLQRLQIWVNADQRFVPR